jgi:hypothetical protein
MPKKSISKKLASLTDIEPPLMRGTKKVPKADEVFTVRAEAKTKKPDDLEISFIQPPDEAIESIPEQKEYFQLPTHFVAVPVDEAPLGWEIETRRHEVKVTKFQHAYCNGP